ncbi:MAG: neutral/alkaline non-lysosomal ceramidase N-terminal domain-containing protein [Lachnospiraceae bacterium]
MITIGFDSQCITPKLPASLRGYAIQRTAAEVHDDIFIRCLLFDDNGRRYLLVQCDLLAADETLTEAVFEKIRDLHIDMEHITITATHTHSGPGGVLNTSSKLYERMQDILGAFDPDYLDFVASRISLAAHTAMENRMECQLKIGRKTDPALQLCLPPHCDRSRKSAADRRFSLCSRSCTLL